MKRIFNEIKSFRLGYAEERRASPSLFLHGTFVDAIAFLLISPFLAVVNVPLSAYNIVQEFTYQPNDTLPTVFLGNLVPSVLHNPTDSFTPQLLSVGETIVLDDNIFNYTIAQAFDGVDTSKPVSTFPYYNNPLSDGCDVANITVQLHMQLVEDIAYPVWFPEIQASGTVVCYLPTLFHLTWRALPLDGARTSIQDIRDMPTFMSIDMADIFFGWSGAEPENVTQVEMGFTVHPCCDCDAVLAGAPLESGASLLESPCSSNPPDFVVVEYQPITLGSGSLSPLSRPMQIADLLPQIYWGNASTSALSIAYENLFQTFYHLIRLDLGVIVDNQIYNSPQMFNRTIMPVDTGESDSWANTTRNSTSDATFMARWLEEAEFFQNNTRVPSLEYLRSVPRLKPMGSAITSVFVSTFAMLSVMWTVFSLVAGALARAHCGHPPNNTPGKQHTLEESRTWDKWLESGAKELDGSQVTLLGRQEHESMEQLRQRVDRNDMRIVRMSAALKQYGVMQDLNWEDDMAMDWVP
ncbi:hypothetical protein MSAN_01977200 [Mycena sanguinolenta]|uniref:Uncharacterized protein n=1 Tax=Mycena sanguinolenta TaxID=230812 RepID=A0A8H6XNC8_9AGAR|nr:hypothetical protein MSAN_01977200 [Mycena sanguinolenta]